MGQPYESTSGDANDVRRFGAVGDGVSDDTDALERALDATGSAVFFSPGRYRISRSLVIDLDKGRSSLRGVGATLIHSGSGPALWIKGSHNGTSDPASVTPITHTHGIMPLIDGLDILGDHPEADGIRLEKTLKAIIAHTIVRDCRWAVHAVERNRDVIIDSCHVFNNAIGIYLDHVDLHQINILGSHISRNGAGGIKVVNGAIRNIQIVGNDIEYNHADGGADIWFEAGNRAIREGTIVGNTIQASPGSGGINIRIEGFADKSPNKAGHLSISGNHIATQSEANIRIRHSRGITIHGNTIKGALSNVVIEDSRAITCSENVFDDNPDYRFGPAEVVARVGNIVLRRTQACNVQGNVLTRPVGGSQDGGGAIEAYDSAHLNISGCTIIGPAWRGIWLEHVKDSIVSNCIIAKGEGIDSMRVGIAESGDCARNVVIGNRVDAGPDGGIRLTSSTSQEHGNLVGPMTDSPSEG